MSARESTCYVITCDECADVFTDWEGNILHHQFDELDTARGLTEEAAWANDGDLDWCDACKVKPHKFTGSDPLVCARCGDADAHDPDEEASDA